MVENVALGRSFFPSLFSPCQYYCTDVLYSLTYRLRDERCQLLGSFPQSVAPLVRIIWKRDIDQPRKRWMEPELDVSGTRIGEQDLSFLYIMMNAGTSWALWLRYILKARKLLSLLCVMSEVLDFHGGECVDCSRVGCDVLWFCRLLPASQECVVSIFHGGWSGDTAFIRSDSNHVQDYTASQPGRPESTLSVTTFVCNMLITGWLHPVPFKGCIQNLIV
jgi:hypothetical protein